MDAKPQRPLRTKTQDENTLPSLPIALAGKTIHQRNKSTPALSAAMQGVALRGAQPKRAAFADVSNLGRSVYLPSKDDSAINGKISHEVVKPAALHVQQDAALKNGTFSRPAQRPLSVKSSSTTALPTTTSVAAIARPASVDSTAPQVQPAAIRKIFTKRSTPVLKDEAAAQDQAVVQAHERTIKSVLEPLAEAAEPSDQEAISVAVGATSAAATLPLVNQSQIAAAEPRPLETGLSIQAAPVVLPLQSVKTQPSMGAPKPVATENHAQHFQHVQEQIDREIGAISSENNAEEEDEELYFDDRYDYDRHTTRSLRTTGDNTTVGMTVVLAPKYTANVKREIEAAKAIVDMSRAPEDIEDEFFDTSMVAEYGDEIFEYMRELEDRMRPNPHYMDHQPDCQWSMRAVLVDWLVQVHGRFTLLPETLFLAVNYIDRFLSCKVVSLGRLQLVGATAIFLAAKYEEVNCPSVQEIVYMVDNGFSQDDILKAERYMLSMLMFELGWPGPMSFLRRISKADDYDLETRTLAKYFLEVTLMDERFVGCAPSFTAAGAHCLARLMLRKGDWTPAHVYYSNYTYSQLRQLLKTIIDCCDDPLKHHGAVFSKYQDKRYKRASHFVQSEMKNGFRLPEVQKAVVPGQHLHHSGASIVDNAAGYSFMPSLNSVDVY